MKKGVSVYITAIAVLAAVCTGGEVPIPGFRPPAIPLVTSDPHMQNWVRADTTTEKEGVTWWDGRARGMVGMVRIDGTAYRWLGTYETQPAPAKNVLTYPGTDIAPARCDISNLPAHHADDCNSACVKTEGCRAFVMKGATCYLKSCVEPRLKLGKHEGAIIVPDADAHEEQDIAPKKCVLAHKTVASQEACAALCAEKQKCVAYVLAPGAAGAAGPTCYLKSCASPLVAAAGHRAFVPRSIHPPPPVQPAALVQKSVRVFPTRTVLVYELPGVVELTVTTLNTMFTDDLLALSNPATTLALDVRALDGRTHAVEAYLGADAAHIVDDLDEEVAVSAWKSARALGARVGTTAQKYFGVHDDHVNVDWGYLHIGVDTQSNGGSTGSATAGAGACSELHSAFEATGTLPSFEQGKKQPARAGPLAIAAAQSLGSVGAEARRAVFVYAYDDVYAVYFFGERQRPYWTTKYAAIGDAIDAALAAHPADLAKAEAHDAKLLADLAAKGGDKFATLAALAYRQTLAATKVTWSEKRQAPELFLKEISTNGDMQTADVIFPASPFFLYTNPQLLQMLLDPLLRYANNETWIPFTDPYSPHQLGVYPVANETTAQQEKMPIENTGNMFLMLLALVQRNGGDVSFFYPRYWKVLTQWADHLLVTLPYPESQLCTDDFLGAVPNNTNLAAKGIVALAAYAQLCDLATHDARCRTRYEAAAQAHAATWLRDALVSDPQPHTILSFSFRNTWSTKYNLLWQKLLRLGDNPFPDFRRLAELEVQWYLAKAKRYGTPLDPRSDWAKLDWLAWAAALAYDDAAYNAIMDRIYAFVHESKTRCPFTDLYVVDEGVALGCASFVARPVVGAIYAKALL